MFNHWGNKIEPFITIKITSKEGYEFFVEQFEKQKAKKPLGVDLHEKTSENIHNWICPMCKHYIEKSGGKFGHEHT